MATKTITFGVQADLAEVKKYLHTVEAKIAPSVAASTLTSIARDMRTDSLNRGASAIGVPTAKLRKRLKAERANPRTLRAKVIAYTRSIPEIKIKANQKGHPGRPRKSSSKAALRMRKRRKAQGARPPKPGGVNGLGRSFPGAWIGYRKDGAGGRQVFRRKGDRLEVVKRDTTPVRRILFSNYRRASGRWRREFDKRMIAALRRRGRTTAASFLERTN